MKAIQLISIDVEAKIEPAARVRNESIVQRQSTCVQLNPPVSADTGYKFASLIKCNLDMPSHSIAIPKMLQETIYDCQTEDDWDDEEAIGVTSKACESAAKFLQTVLLLNPSVKMPKVSPSVYGSVSLHWRYDNSHLVVRPSPDLDLAYYRYETADENPSISGDEAKLQVAIRVVDFLKAAHAKQS